MVLTISKSNHWGRRAAQSTDRRALPPSSQRSLRQKRSEQFVNGCSIRVDGKAIGKDQRSAAYCRSVMHGDCNHPAKQSDANVRFSIPSPCIAERIASAKIVARHSGRCRLAFAIARVIECDRSPSAAEIAKLGTPDRFVGTDAVEEDGGKSGSPASFATDQAQAGAGGDLRHGCTLAARPCPRASVGRWHG